MNWFKKIKEMDVEELASFLVCESIEEVEDFDWEENPYTTPHRCYVTPFCQYPYYWSREEVVEDTVKSLKENEVLDGFNDRYAELKDGTVGLILCSGSDGLTIRPLSWSKDIIERMGGENEAWITIGWDLVRRTYDE